MTGAPPLTALVIVKDEADRIDACLRSVAFCDEVLVLDSGSTDDTVRIAGAAGARVVETDWPGYVAQKNRGADEAAHDWILSIDADEQVDDDLRRAIERIRADGFLGARVYAVRRKVRAYGRWIRHGGWYPEWRPRLYHRAHAQWEGPEPHERLVGDGPVVRIEQGDLEHRTYRDLRDHATRQARYAALWAADRYERGRRAGVLSLLFRPAFRFLRMYVLRLGFLDGVPGLIVAAMEAHGVFLKYAGLWERGRRE